MRTFSHKWNTQHKRSKNTQTTYGFIFIFITHLQFLQIQNCKFIKFLYGQNYKPSQLQLQFLEGKNYEHSFLTILSKKIGILSHNAQLPKSLAHSKN